MEAVEYKSNNTNDVLILKGNDNEYYSYCTSEKWNGEYYKGWRSDEFGDALDDEIYKINPIHVPVGEPDEDGEYEFYEVQYYIVERF